MPEPTSGTGAGLLPATTTVLNRQPGLPGPTGMFSWTVVEPGETPRLGAVGVCDDRDRAVRRLVEAMQDSPAGAVGVLHRVHLGMGGAYYYDRLLAGMRRDGDVLRVEEWGAGGLPGAAGDLYDEIKRLPAGMAA
ncbi:hypothetical protein [Thermomonospora cellulosilytica]|uniref:Uncharacterized protein n=1 Tax=Thermomonospora cellulosilytica TaxID=1411118 RepID=A0A7W3RAK1_9ACTN|nr:hypothetical protein [Thermomonospora cellulosilytica]MBA9005926.1 hypothetical protein [Thermomonospora cellulosilytica]